MFDNRYRTGNLRIFLIALTTSLCVGLLSLFFLGSYLGNTSKHPETLPETTDIQSPLLQQQQISFETTTSSAGVTGVARTSIPGVVGISVLRVSGESIFDRNSTEKWGLGSGVIVNANGYILTNNHVAGGKSKRIIVSLADGRNIEGVTVWSDSVIDLAIVKVNADNLSAIPIGDAAKLQVGEPAIAIGNPLGMQFQRTVTSGIVSALNRTIKIETEQGSNFMEDLIQTDASINPGNSGGPLLNSNGEVVGINTIKVTSAEGMGFAIPINAAVPIINSFTADGDFKETYMGIFAYDKEIIPFVEDTVKLDKGIYVAQIDEAGPAYRSGLRLGCIILKVDGIDIETMMQLRTYIYSKKPGDTIQVTHLSKGRTETVPVVLGAEEKDGMVTR